MYVYICVYIYIYVYVCVYISIYVYVCVYIYICVYTADSLCCTTEAQHCKAIILPIKNSSAHVHSIAVLLSKGQNGTYHLF